MEYVVLSANLQESLRHAERLPPQWLVLQCKVNVRRIAKARFPRNQHIALKAERSLSTGKPPGISARRRGQMQDPHRGRTSRHAPAANRLASAGGTRTSARKSAASTANPACSQCPRSWA